MAEVVELLHHVPNPRHSKNQKKKAKKAVNAAIRSKLSKLYAATTVPRALTGPIAALDNENFLYKGRACRPVAGVVGYYGQKMGVRGGEGWTKYIDLPIFDSVGGKRENQRQKEEKKPGQSNKDRKWKKTPEGRSVYFVPFRQWEKKKEPASAIKFPTEPEAYFFFGAEGDLRALTSAGVDMRPLLGKCCDIRGAVHGKLAANCKERGIVS